MLTNKKVSGKAVSMPVGIVLGASVALAMTLLFAMGITQLILSEKIGEKSIGYWAIAVLPVATAAGALLAVWRIKRRRMQVCLITAAVYYFILILINVLFFGGQFGGMGVALIMVLAGAIVVGLAGAKGERRSSRNRRKYHSR